MTLEQIRTELETAEGLPAAALVEAVTQAQALSPDVIALLDKAASGVHLLPRQQNLLFFGLHALAAARRTEACQPFLALLRCPEWQLEHLLGDALTETATGLLLGLYDGDPEPLFSAVEDRDAGSSMRWTLFQVLARLCWEGRIPQERLVALIDRFDREELAEPGDLAWIGWEDAIRLLGLQTFEPRVRQGWNSGRVALHKEIDQDEWLSLLNQAVLNPRDPRRFIDDRVVPITDPVADLAWIARHDRRSNAAEAEEKEESPDPAQAIRLSEEELAWLGGFLDSEQVGSNSLSLEHLDGYFTALVVGPVAVPPAEYLDAIWGMGEGEGPSYDSLEQAEFVADLLARHQETIAMRLDALHSHRPIIFPLALEDRGKAWAEGFAMGIALRQEEWAPVFRHKSTSPLVWAILALIEEEYDPEAEPINLDERAQILDLLPISILAISAFWRDPEMQKPPMPVRSEKIGRNQPCPCGSGRKYKKCCGAAA